VDLVPLKVPSDCWEPREGAKIDRSDPLGKTRIDDRVLSLEGLRGGRGCDLVYETRVLHSNSVRSGLDRRLAGGPLNGAH
jgi:hypothetical protein